MNETLRTIRLYGKLGAKFGRVHRLVVATPAEAVHAMCIVLPGFRRFLAESDAAGTKFAIFAGKRNLPPDELVFQNGDADIRIAPIIAGAKRGGLFQTLLGVALIAGATFAAGGVGAAFTAGGLTGTSATLGAALALGGIAQMLAPQQRALGTKDSPNNGASYNFNGPVNTVAQGNPVPVLYGEMIVGSVVISAGIYAEDAV